MPTQQELLLRQMTVKLALAVLSLEAALKASNPTPNPEMVKELKTLSDKLKDYMDLFDQSLELDKVG